MKNKMIFENDPENIVDSAVLWKSKNGSFHFTEQQAKRASATHKHCKCGEVIESLDKVYYYPIAERTNYERA